MAKQKIIVSVTNDLSTDQRADKICNTLTNLGYDVLLIGRYYKTSQFIYRNYETKRFNLWFNKGFLFYANYNIRLFIFLLFTDSAILWSNDLDTLPSNYIISKWKNVKLVFDSHEYFTEVPELINRPTIQKIWKGIERKILPKITHVITVSQSIVNLFEKEYNIKVQLLRNVPSIKKEITEVENIKVAGKKTIIYQGAINVNRGIEQMVLAMLHIDDATLYIAGSGDISEKIKTLIVTNELSKKVIMLGKIPLEKLHSYTTQADLGLSLEEDAGLNYRFALPNKLFDYIQAEIPVLVANLPEMEKLAKQYEVGSVIENHSPEHIAKKIKGMLANQEQIDTWKTNCTKAAQELNWEKETQFLEDFLNESK
ncbi:MAG: glycosyltransferase [Vicingaceae bacterium]|nr:glycosyltransferase [Vicingaceae bacterium]